jgi:pyruvate formate lyase activating enzyme
MKGLVFNIQRYSLHDGTGIRTIVFLKGCPLHCPWCCNPESQSFEKERAKINNLCIKCKICCFDIDECPSGAIAEFGKYMTEEEVLAEVQKDMIFYNTSGGGVTLSGGEATAQQQFALELLKAFKKLGINTAMETSGQVAVNSLMDLSQYLDLILFDLKIMNKNKSKELLGADIDLIKANIKVLVENNKKVIPRIPLIPGYTMDDENIKEIINFIKELGLKEITILPFHQYGSKKYEYIKKQYELKHIKPPTNQEVEGIKAKMESQGLKVTIGGL